MCNYSPAAGAVREHRAARWVAVTPARTNADFYYQIGFTAAAGNLDAGATAEFQAAVGTRTTGRNYTQANDYSYNGARRRSRRRPR